MGVKMPFKNGNKDLNKFLFDFTVMCGQLCICEHIALENKKVREQLAIKEPLQQKLKHLKNILESEF